MSEAIAKRIVRPIDWSCDDYLEALKGEEHRAWLEARTLIVDRLADLELAGELEGVGDVSHDMVETLTSLFVVYQIKTNGGHNDDRLDEFLRFCKLFGATLVTHD